MTTWLITGGTGYLGRHVVQAVTAREMGRVVVLARRRGPNIAALDLTSPEEAARMVEEVRPDVVLHLAGRVPPAPAEAFYRTNTLGTLHLLDALRAQGRPVRVVLVGSAAELGPVAVEDLPVGEDQPCRPADAYGLSKLLATTAGLAARPPLDVVAARLFNPIGPGLPASQAFGHFARTLAAPGPDPVVLPVGDLEARRDLLDVRDAAGAIVALASEGRPGTLYHVGSGRSVRMGDGLELLICLSDRDVRVEVDPARISPRAPRDSRADIRRIVEHIQWRPTLSWEQSLRDLWADLKSGTDARADREPSDAGDLEDLPA